MSEIAALEGWLRTQGLTLVPEAALQRLSGGIANRNDRIELTCGPAVLRRPPPGVLAAGASDMGREWRVMRALAPHLPIVPRPLAFCDDAAVLGTPFLVIEFREGMAIGGVMPEGGDLAALVDATLAQMIGLHGVDAAAVGLGELGRPAGFYARQLAGWTKRAEAVWPEANPAGDLVAALAVALPGDDAAAVLLHMDLKPDNLLVDPATMQPLAMIDWDMATRGPRGFDLAVLLSYWIEPEDPAAVRTLKAVPSLEAGAPGRAAVAARYTALGGRDPGDLVWPVALARLRLATAWMQLYRKWQRGEMIGARYAGFETLARAILAHALAQFNKGRI